MKNLMPLIVNVLESLDLAYTESSEFEVSYYLDKGVDIVKGGTAVISLYFNTVS